MNNKDRITGKIVLKAVLKNISPVLIGKGSGEASDVDVMRLPDDNPYIPGSSIAGTIRSFFYEYVEKQLKTTNEKNNVEFFWGSDNTQKTVTCQSHIIFEDVLLKNEAKVIVRDGVKINSVTNIVEKGGKYDYELIEPGAEFNFYAEITIREGIHEFAKKMACFIYDSLTDDSFRIGALTNTGFGKIKLIEQHTWYFNFKDVGTDKNWFEFLKNGTVNLNELKLEEIKEKFKINKNEFRIEADFTIKSALIIGSYGINPNDPDKSHLQSNGKHILSGKSIRGALRHRALKILNAKGVSNAEGYLDNLFGWVSEKSELKHNALTNKKVKAIKGRLRINEVILDSNQVMPLKQDRIKIDRFTGGTISGAKFDSQPIWKISDKKFTLSFNLRNPQSLEIELLLHLLKDLWIEDLAIGGEKNVGRGIITGYEASIFYNDIPVDTIKRNVDKSGLTFISGNSGKINKFISEFKIVT